MSGNTNIDGISVATSWSQAPLPVELISFTASASNEQIRLNWETSTELNNFGFEIERLNWRQQSMEEDWICRRAWQQQLS